MIDVLVEGGTRPHHGIPDAGVPVAVSSDRPVAAGSPLRTIECFVTRRASSGARVGPDEAITVEEALHCHTLAGLTRVRCRGRQDCGVCAQKCGWRGL